MPSDTAIIVDKKWSMDQIRRWTHTHYWSQKNNKGSWSLIKRSTTIAISQKISSMQLHKVSKWQPLDQKQSAAEMKSRETCPANRHWQTLAALTNGLTCQSRMAPHRQEKPIITHRVKNKSPLRFVKELGSTTIGRRMNEMMIIR